MRTRGFRKPEWLRIQHREQLAVDVAAINRAAQTRPAASERQVSRVQGAGAEILVRKLKDNPVVIISPANSEWPGEVRVPFRDATVKEAIERSIDPNPRAKPLISEIYVPGSIIIDFGHVEAQVTLAADRGSSEEIPVNVFVCKSLEAAQWALDGAGYKSEKVVQALLSAYTLT